MKMPRQINSASPRSSATAVVRHPCGPTADRADGRRLRPGGHCAGRPSATSMLVRAFPVSPSVRAQSNLHYSPNLDGGDALPPSGGGAKASKTSNPNSNAGQPPRTAAPGPDRRYVAREVLIEIAGTPSDADADALARRHRLTRVQFQACRWLTGHCFAGASPTPVRWRAW